MGRKLEKIAQIYIYPEWLVVEKIESQQVQSVSGNARDAGLIHGSGRFPGIRK